VAPLGFPPYVDITSRPAWVTYDISRYTISGTNNIWVTNLMVWSTSAGFSGTVVAAQGWIISNIPLVVGSNTIMVRGWDDFKRSSTDTVVITRGGVGTGLPYLDVTSAPAWVSYDVTVHSISGTNNIHTVGAIVWENSRGGSGSVPAGQAWSITDIPLQPGMNVVTVTATNELGIVSSDSVAITRGEAGTGVPHVDITNSTIELYDDLGPCVIGGTNNLNVVGIVWWTNSLGGCGAMPATLSWQIAGIVVQEGTNRITVTGTNAFGVVSSDEVLIICRLTKRMLQTVLHSAPTPPPGYERTARITNWQDAHINATWPGGAAGREEAMYMGAGSRMLAGGTLVGLLPPDVLRVRLRVYNGGYYERTPIFWRARLVTAPWVEEEVTWEERAAGTPWSAAGGDTAPGPEASGWAVIDDERYHDFDVTPLVKAWQAAPQSYHGILIETASGNAAMYVSADNGSDDVLQQPHLVIDHLVTPFVDITNESAHVANAVTTYEIGGTNNVHIVGMMTWSNSLLAGVYSFAAAPSWTVSDISLGVGINVITVIGSNAFGDVHADSIVITRDDVDAGTGVPLTVITNGNAVVMNDVSAWSIGGSNNHHVVGGMRWENSLGGSGSFPAAAYWQVEGIPLEAGANVLTVIGTNAFGQASRASITVTRREPGTGEPFVDITNQHAIVPPEEMVCMIGGTNNAQVVGWMVWSNLLTRVHGIMPASQTWEIEDILLDVGHNTIVVYGTNKFGVGAGDMVIISRSPGPPEVAITTPSGSVSNEVTSVNIQGTAGEYVVGRLTWSNELTGAAGSVQASPAWQVNGIELAEGANEIRVTGTNMVGERASAAVTITRLAAGIHAPELAIETPDMHVPAAVTMIAITGSCSGADGALTWENSASDERGNVAATAVWVVPEVALVTGTNVISVTATNRYGMATVRQVVIVRATEAAPTALEEFSIVYEREAGAAVLTWSNVAARVDVLVCRERYYTTNAAAWRVAAENAVAPWQDGAAGEWTASYYRLVSGGVTSAYDVGFMTVYVRQADGNHVENWLSSPFDFMDARGGLAGSLPFAVVGVDAVVNNEAGAPSRRDFVFTQKATGDIEYAARRNGTWLASSAAATNWYRNQMYIVKINRVHGGAAKPLTFYGRVSTNDPAEVAQIRQSDGQEDRDNWCVAWWPWVVPFNNAGLAAVVTDESGLPNRRDKVASQTAPGGTQIMAARGNGIWITTEPAATNLYPGHGYKVIINKKHTRAARTWLQPRIMP